MIIDDSGHSGKINGVTGALHFRISACLGVLDVRHIFVLSYITFQTQVVNIKMRGGTLGLSIQE